MRILSGIQPSGALHIGNYFGMMRPAIALQAQGEAFYFIADYHALTSLRDPNSLRENVRARLRSIFSPQRTRPKARHFPAIGCATGDGVDLDSFHGHTDGPAWNWRIHTKIKSHAACRLMPDLFTYPVLMAADI